MENSTVKPDVIGAGPDMRKTLASVIIMEKATREPSAVLRTLTHCLKVPEVGPWPQDRVAAHLPFLEVPLYSSTCCQAPLSQSELLNWSQRQAGHRDDCRSGVHGGWVGGDSVQHPRGSLWGSLGVFRGTYPLQQQQEEKKREIWEMLVQNHRALNN